MNIRKVKTWEECLGICLCAIAVFVVVLCYPFLETSENKRKIGFVNGIYGLMVLLAVLQLQNNALNSYTFYDEDYYVSLIQIQEAKSECDKLQDVLSEGEKVYIINQSGETRPMNVFAYYLNGICNSYLYEPWMFYDGGVKIRGWDNTGLNMDVLTFMLAVGSYDYIYVYEKDAYLEEQLREMYGLESLEERVLYRVVHIGDHFYLNRAYNIQE